MRPAPVRPRSAAPPAARARLSGLEALALLLPFLAVLAALFALGLPLLILDEWDGFGAFLIEARRHGLSAGLLWAPHNEHRLILPRLLLYGYSHVGVSMVPVMVASQLVLGLAFLLLLPELRDAASAWSPRQRALLYFLSSALFFSFGQWENTFWGFQIAWSLELLGLILALRNLRRGRYPYFFAGVLLAALCSAHWLILLPVALYAEALGLWRGRTSGDRAVRLLHGVGRLLVLGLLAALYLRGARDTGQATELYALRRPVEAAMYITTFIGNPFFPRLPFPSGYLAPLFGGAFLLTLLGLLLRRKLSPTSPAFYLIAGMGLLAVLVCLGRLYLGIGQSLSSRYVTLTGFAWVVLLGRVVRAWGDRRPVRHAVLLTLSVAFAASLFNLRHKVREHQPQVLAARECLRAHLCGQTPPPSDTCLLPLYFSPPRLKVLARELQQLGLLRLD